jgi:hypothetical protein
VAVKVAVISHAVKVAAGVWSDFVRFKRAALSLKVFDDESSLFWAGEINARVHQFRI